MVDEIFTAVTLALHREFPDAHIFTQTVQQGLKDGDFIVGLSSWKPRPLPGGIQQCTAVFDIAYYAGENREAGFVVAEKLCGLLEVIPLFGGTLLRGYPQWKSFDGGILRLQLRCSCCLAPGGSAEQMESLEVKKNAADI